LRVPLVVSHAAAGGLAPENTLQGIRAALAAGADAIEFDVHCTADGVPVVIHDPTLDRTGGVPGAVAEMTLAQVQRADVGGEPPPTLAEALAEIRGRAAAVIEIKPAGITEPVAQVVRRTQAEDWTVIWSFVDEVVAEARYLLPGSPACLLTPNLEEYRWPAEEVLRRALNLGAQGVSVEHTSVNQELVAFAASRALTVFAWTADDETDWARLVQAGVTGIVSNQPGRLRAFLSTG
jgi:glycerophosphoryl diester phosphodiesterase